MNDQPPPSSILLPLLWIAGVIAVSVLYRRSRGKPILFFNVPGASYIERAASGNSHRHWYSRIGGARSCLVVAIFEGKLIVRPWFPFNLMFLPEIYHLEHEIPLERVKSVQVGKGLFKRVIVEFQNENCEAQAMTLFLKKPDDFIAHLPAAVAVIGSERG
ncbi:MAG: hypothetical protein A2521_00230 [Deltaproteobacteria bacterium RIFOXYD12_FULL_57_12]|nr:MAG: hypothetical protein A2521_00230 [Deltaproteobacteria bacterium RIFOXYD12_FULL_57_12]